MKANPLKGLLGKGGTDKSNGDSRSKATQIQLSKTDGSESGPEFNRRVELTPKEAFNENVLWMWDGLGFFGDGHHKLDRLDGVRFRWWHKIFSLSEGVTMLISFSLISYILLSEFSQLGSVKGQISSLITLD